MRQLALKVVLLVIALGITACDTDPDLQTIRSNIREMSVSAENHNEAGITRYISNSYRGVAGTRSGLSTLLQRHFKLNKNINLIISDIEIMIAEDKQTAKVNLRVLMTGGDGNLPERGRLNAIKSTWEKQNGNWLVTGATWKPVLLQF